jgi:PAS domain S-box-containing protein
MVLAGVAEGVVGVDCDGNTTFVNARAGELLGWESSALVGRDLHAVTHSRRPDGSPFPAEDCPVSQVLASGTSQRLLHGTFWRRDGHPLPVDWSVGAVTDHDGMHGAVVVFGDASQRQRTEKMKDDFVSVVSHELRTPLTSVTGALKLLEGGVGGPLEPRGAELVRLALRNGQRLARLVDDILDVERSASGGMTLARRRLSVAELVHAAAATVQGAAEARGVVVQVEPPPGDVWGDEHRLLQVLTNLLGNALRFSPDGSTVRLHGTRDGTGVTVRVSDQGIGIPADVVDRVFDRFWQAESGARRSTGGTGLGLAIAKNIVELHDGSITVDSTEGAGTTFSVWLPLRHQARRVPVERRGAPDTSKDEDG